MSGWKTFSAEGWVFLHGLGSQNLFPGFLRRSWYSFRSPSTRSESPPHPVSVPTPPGVPRTEGSPKREVGRRSLLVSSLLSLSTYGSQACYGRSGGSGRLRENNGRVRDHGTPNHRLYLTPESRTLGPRPLFGSICVYLLSPVQGTVVISVTEGTRDRR